jgi:hypothetical protein
MIKDDDRISSHHVNPQHTSTCSVKEDKIGMPCQEQLLVPDSNLDRSSTRIRRTRNHVVPRESSIQESLWSDYSSDSSTSTSSSSTSFSKRRRRRRRQLRLLQEEKFVLQKEQFEVQRMFQIMIEINNFSLEANNRDDNSNDGNVSTLSSLSGYETDDD